MAEVFRNPQFMRRIHGQTLPNKSIYLKRLSNVSTLLFTNQLARSDDIALGNGSPKILINRRSCYLSAIYTTLSVLVPEKSHSLSLTEKQAGSMGAELPPKARKQTVKEEFKDFLERDQAWDSEGSFTTGDGGSSGGDESESESEDEQLVKRKSRTVPKRKSQQSKQSGAEHEQSLLTRQGRKDRDSAIATDSDNDSLFEGEHSPKTANQSELIEGYRAASGEPE